MTRGQEIFNWITARINEGRTVYVQTCLRTTVIKAKHLRFVRVSGEHCQIARGKHWDSINYCRIVAQ